ncbi:hypothetical protein ACIRON_20600 [Nocardioides sp. NPDC101246]|uniref:hypothetical protein n=1 Tax=Nocardioides sp. NPDC101246 TaxID=3364336 RepID=UPI00381DE5B3
MADLKISDLPEDVPDALAQRAKDRGQALNSYLREIVIRAAYITSNRTLIDDVIAARGHSKFTTEDVLAARDAAHGQCSPHP